MGGVTGSRSRFLPLFALFAGATLAGCLDGPARSDARAVDPSTSVDPSVPVPSADPTAPKTIVKVHPNATKVGYEHFHNYWGEGPDARTQ